MFCGSCMHDNTLAAALIRLGVDVLLIPTYTPIRTDEENVSLDQVFFGGINAFLQQRIPFFRRVHPALDWWLDHPSMIRLVASVGLKTDAAQLGEMTVSMLRGEAGHQRKEVNRLVGWLVEQGRPNLVNLSNILIGGCVREIKKNLRIPVLVTLQGDDIFIEQLLRPYKEEALSEIRRIADGVDGFIVFTRYYARFMARYLDLPEDRFHVVPLGIASTDYDREPDPAPSRPHTVGYLARICPAKGLHVLVDAFLLLRTMPGMEGVQLRAAGWLGREDREFFRAQVERLRRAGVDGQFQYDGVLERRAKLDFLRGLDVLSVPTVYREPKGIFVLEAMASGVPVVQPDHGAFPEILEATGAGELVRPNDPYDLAGALNRLLRDSTTRRTLGERGRAAVRANFNAERMARLTLDVYREYLSRDAPLAST
jgi:glycosyltransferase involved in cell wall biosynthesis